MNLSIVIPIYNASKIIKDNIKKIMNILNTLNVEYEILLRDDGSKDKSRLVLEDISKEFPEVKCYYNSINVGLGYTLRKLFKNTKGDNIIYLDCDLPYSEKIIPTFLKEIRHCDIVVASRYNGIKNSVKLNRKIFSRLYYQICRLLFGIKIKDIGSGSVCFSKKVFDIIKLTSSGFDIHVELFVEANKAGLIVREIPFRSNQSKISTFSTFRYGPEIIFNTLKFWFKLNFN